jgi:hypothetical protein
VTLTITDDFGRRALLESRAPKLAGEDTVMRLLERNARVGTRYGGGFVQSIDGRTGGRRGTRPIDWFYYLNGIEASVGAAGVHVRPGDRIWWDRHDWGATLSTPAVVGSFPEPFRHRAAAGQPVRVHCAPARSAACPVVVAALRAEGVAATDRAARPGERSAAVRVLVGLWPSLRHDRAASQLEHGPAPGGVYARPDPSGRALAVLDQTARTVRTLGAGAGLVAATRRASEDPSWIVTGTDEAGLLAAARSLREPLLHDRFAVAVSASHVLALPEVSA